MRMEDKIMDMIHYFEAMLVLRTAVPGIERIITSWNSSLILKTAISISINLIIVTGY